MFSNLFIRFLSGQAGLVKRWFMPPLRLSSGLSQNRRIVLYIRHSKARTGRCVCILLVTFPILGRPGIVAIRIRSGVVRIQITRRTITVVGIAAKTRSRLPVRSFNLPFPVQRPKSRCFACRETAGFGGACSPFIPPAAELHTQSRLGQTRHSGET